MSTNRIVEKESPKTIYHCVLFKIQHPNILATEGMVTTKHNNIKQMKNENIKNLLLKGDDNKKGFSLFILNA